MSEKSPIKKSAEKESTTKKGIENKGVEIPGIVVFIVVGALVLLSVVSIVYLYGAKHGQPDESEYYDYNNFRFVRQGPLWVTQVQAGQYIYTVPLHYSPRDLTEVKVSGAFSQKFADANYVYLTFDPNDVGESLETVNVTESGEGSRMTLAASELSIVLSQAIRRNPIAACTRNETDACRDRAIMQCWREGEPVIYLHDVDDAKVTFYGDCIELTGEGDGIVKAVDRLLLFWLGVMR